jgi:hypothetical protein
MTSGGIQWSLPVLIRKTADGGLCAAIPPKAAAELGGAEGDVLNWTKLPDGTVEVWVVKKSGYASLTDIAATRS